MGELRSLFPSMARRAPGAATLQIDLDDEAGLTQALDVVDDVLEAAFGAGADALEAAADELLEDVVTARERSPHTGLDVVQLHIVLGPLALMSSLRRFDCAWRWAVAACTTDLPEDRVADMDLEQPFRAAARYPLLAEPAVLRWAGLLCYLAWSAGYLHEEEIGRAHV